MCCGDISSGARGGAGGARAPPIGLWSMQNRMYFVLLRPIFCEKWKIAPPIRNEPPLIRLNLRNRKNNRPEFWRRPFFFFFFWRSPTYGRKKRLNSGFRPKNHSEFWRRPFFFYLFIYFFGDHLLLGGKNVWILDFGRKITLNFGEDLFFFFFFWRSPTFGWKKRLNFRFRPKNLSEFWRRPFFFFLWRSPNFGRKKLWISDLSETFHLKFWTNRVKLIQGQWKFESRSFAHFSLFQNSPPLFQILATRLGGIMVKDADVWNCRDWTELASNT